MKRKVFAWFLSFATTYAYSQDTPSTQLNVIDSVDLVRYGGTWYEIARLPNRFQDDCIGDVTATYTLLEDGQIKVVNRCRTEDGTFSEVEGRARRASKDGPISKLEVRFAPAFLSFLPFVWGDYWILDLASDYSYAVIGEPDREFLWVLARSPQMDQGTLGKVLERVEKQGYMLDRLIQTKHTQGGQ
jgi:apolipoprotein D and lipocalin family protein